MSNAPRRAESTRGNSREDAAPAFEGDAARLTPVLRAAADYAFEGVLIADPSGMIVFANPALAALAGTTTDALVGADIDSLVRPADRPGPSSLTERLRDEDGFVGEASWGRPDEAGRPVFARVFVCQDDRGAALGLVGCLRETVERNPLAERLRDAEAGYRNLVDMAPDAFVFLDLNGKILLTNARAADELGYADLDEFLAANEFIYDLIVPEDRPRALRELAECLVGDEKRGVCFDCLCRDGSTLPVEVCSRALKTVDGMPTGIIAIARNVTMRREAEKSLQLHRAVEQLVTHVATRFIRLAPEEIDAAIEESLRQTAARLEVDCSFVCLFDGEGLRVERHFQWCRVHGHTPGAPPLGVPLDDFPWMAAQLRDLKHVIVASADELPAEAVSERAYLDARSLGSFLVVPMVGRGRLVGYLGFCHRGGGRLWQDNLVTLLVVLAEIFSNAIGRKRADELHRESEERFRQLAGAMHEMFWLIDSDFSRGLYVSPAFQEAWGVDPEVLYENPMAFLDFVHPEDRYPLQRVFRERFLGPVREGDFRIIRPDGTLRWLKGRAFPVYDSEGRLYRLAGIVEDVTDRKRMEREILDISSREQRRIGRDLHDGLGQHLTGVLCLGSDLARTLAARGAPEAGQADEIVELLREAIAQTRRLARGLCPVAMDATGLVHALENLVSSTRHMAGIDCVFRCDPDVLVADPARAENLYRIAQEAVGNAVRHARAARIEVDLHRQDENCVLQVSDDGVGIPDPALRGMGMGMRLMEYRARISSAELSVESAASGGTVVTCRFRIAPDGRKEDPP